MFSKKSLAIVLGVAAMLVIVEGLYLYKYVKPEVRFIQVWKDRADNFDGKVDPSSLPEASSPEPVNTPTAEPEWLKKYPQLLFLNDGGNKREVQVVESGSDGSMFALRKPTDSWMGDYSLWFVDKRSQEKMLDADVINDCSSVEIINDSENYVTLKVGRSPCEAGISTDVYYYEKINGELVYSLSYASGYAEGEGNFILGKDDGIGDFSIEPTYRGDCSTEQKYSEDNGHAPILDFLGMTIKTTNATKFFALPVKKQIFCVMKYGGGFDYPGIDHATIEGDKAWFSTSFGDSIEVSIKNPLATPSFAVLKALWPSDKPDAALVAALPENVREQIQRSHIPMYAFNIAGLRDQRLDSFNGWTTLSTAADDEGKVYSIYLTGKFSFDEPMGRSMDETVRGAAVSIKETNGVYEASWREDDILYTLEMRCKDYSDKGCQTEEKITELLKNIFYIGGSYK